MSFIRSPRCFVNLVVAWSLALAFTGCSPSAPVTNKPEPPKKAEVSTLLETANWSAWRKDELTTDEFSPEEGFRVLTLSDFEPYFAKPPKADAVPTWSAVGSAIVCTGKPKGYLHSKEKFQDFTLRLELRFAPAVDTVAVKDFNPNSGVMVYITEPHKQWPKSLEVQGKFSELGTIKANGKAAEVQLVDDTTRRESARKPVSEWNALEILSHGGALTVLLNGQKVCESQPSDVSSGPIGLQSEDFEVHFRRLRIRAE